MNDHTLGLLVLLGIVSFAAYCSIGMPISDAIRDAAKNNVCHHDAGVDR